MKNVPEIEEKKPSTTTKNKYEDYEMDGWVDTLIRAEEIKQDPDKMKALGPLIRKKMKVFKSIEDLEAYAQEKINDEDGSND